MINQKLGWCRWIWKWTIDGDDDDNNDGDDDHHHDDDKGNRYIEWKTKIVEQDVLKLIPKHSLPKKDILDLNDVWILVGLTKPKTLKYIAEKAEIQIILLHLKWLFRNRWQRQKY